MKLLGRRCRLALLLAAATVLALAPHPSPAHPSHDDDDDVHGHSDGDEAVALFRRGQALARREAAAACHTSLAVRDAEATHSRLARRAFSLGSDPSSFGPALSRRASCVVDPETTGGPYYVNGLIQRSNMTENQPGVALVLDVSVVDIATCSPLVNAAVEFWSCNATGYYSGFTGVSPRTGQLVGSCVNGGGSGGGGGCMTDELTFLRGLILTDSNGVAEVTTIFPGYYVGRTPHIHVTVHTGGSVGPDGTYVGGALRHVGQLFPGDDAAAAVYAAAPSLYGTAGTDFLRLAGDSIAMGGGYAGKGVLSLSSLGPSISQGLIGAVTIYVDAAVTQRDLSTYTYGSDAPWVGTSVATRASFTTARGSTLGASTTRSTSVASAAQAHPLFCGSSLLVVCSLGWTILVASVL